LTKVTLTDTTVAIIGTGTIGSTLAANFAAGGQDFLLAGRDQDKTSKVASDVSGHAETVSVDEAVDRADVIVVAVWLDDFKQFIARYGDRLAGKVIVDPSNPVGPMAPAAIARSSASRSHRARSWRACCQPERGWSRRSAPCRPPHWRRPRGGSLSGPCSSTPRTTPPLATWSPT
jgi:UDP-N-acetyl-D-mannosaminuronate dehydrogenase